MASKHISHCLLCKNVKLLKIFDYGKTPLANAFSNYGDYLEDEAFPLCLMRCSSCGHFQLDTIIDNETLYSDYLYVSGTSEVNRKHFSDYADQIKNKFLKEGGTYLDVGSNDETLLSHFDHYKYTRIGVEPAKNIAAKYSADTVNVFFNEETAKNQITDHLKLYHYRSSNSFDVITLNHMFAHNEDLDTIVKGVLHLLSNEGVFIFENAYVLDMFEKNLFDLMYHEHQHAHSLTPMIKYLRKFGVKVFDVLRLPNQHGGSIRVFCCRNSDSRQVSQAVFDMLEEEKVKFPLPKYGDRYEEFVPQSDIIYDTCGNTIGMSCTSPCYTIKDSTPETIQLFRTNIKNLKTEFRNLLDKLLAEKKTIHCFGYAAKTTTLLYTYGVQKGEIRACYEDAKLKIGKWSPGLHIPIVSPNKLLENNPDCVVLGAWNFAESIIRTHRKYVHQGGIFIIPLPQLKIIDKTNIDSYLKDYI